MRRLLALSILLVFPIGQADERLAEVAAYINAVWFAEEYNERCPESPIEVPVSEDELRGLLVLADGGNFVDVVAQDPNTPGINSRDNMKELARDSTARGCDSETSVALRRRVEEELTVPALISEFLQEFGASQ